MPSEWVSASDMKKYNAYGAAIIELGKEREKQEEIRNLMPGAPLAKIMAAQMAKSVITPADEERMRMAATRRAHPNARPPPTNEMEQIIADEPKSSSQVIGHHKVPQLTVPKKPPKQLTEIEKMRNVFPGRESHMVGFHHNFGNARGADAADAQALIARLKSGQAAKDPELKAALVKLRQHVHTQSTMKDMMGVEFGIRRR